MNTSGWISSVWFLSDWHAVALFFLAVLGLRCCAKAFAGCGERRLTLHCSARASHCGGFCCCGARALGTRASVVVARKLSSCGARVAPRHVGSSWTRDRTCPLHWQADS